jgi:hypothetical protein
MQREREGLSLGLSGACFELVYRESYEAVLRTDC